jgi:S1-C subfamily serine protease
MSEMRNLATVVYPESEFNLSDIIEIVSPAIVLISISGANFKAAGTGFIVDTAVMWLPTSMLSRIQYLFGSTSALGSLSMLNLSIQTEKDMAILKIISPKIDFSTIKLGSASESAVGNSVFAIGVPSRL